MADEDLTEIEQLADYFAERIRRERQRTVERIRARILAIDSTGQVTADELMAILDHVGYGIES